MFLCKVVLLIIVAQLQSMERVTDSTPLLKRQSSDIIDIEAQLPETKRSLSFSKTYLQRLPPELLYDLTHFIPDGQAALPFLLNNTPLADRNADKALARLLAIATNVDRQLIYVKKNFKGSLHSATKRFKSRLRHMVTSYRISDEESLNILLKDTIGTFDELRSLPQWPRQEEYIQTVSRKVMYYQYIMQHFDRQDENVMNRAHCAEKMSTWAWGRPSIHCAFFYAGSIIGLFFTSIGSAIVDSIFRPRFDYVGCDNFYLNDCLYANSTNMYECPCIGFNTQCSGRDWLSDYCQMCYRCCKDDMRTICNILQHQFQAHENDLLYWSPTIALACIVIILPFISLLLAKKCVRPRNISDECKDLVRNYKTEIEKLRTYAHP